MRNTLLGIGLLAAVTVLGALLIDEAEAATLFSHAAAIPGAARRGRARGRMREATAGPVQVQIERLAAGGDGVAHLDDGCVVFVPGSAPGDRLRVRVTQRRRRYARAEIERVLEPGPGRREPACPAFGRCGGCAWQHLDYEAQLAAKRAILVDALERIGGLVAGSGCDAVVDFVASPDEYHYRGRARVLAADGAVGYRERRSHRLCPVTRCPVLAAPLEDALEALAGRVAREHAARPRPGRGAQPQEWALQLGREGRAQATRLVPGENASALPLPLGGDAVAVSAGTFAQANVLLLDALRAAVTTAAGHGERALELHCGAGFFTLALAPRFGSLRAVEASPPAIADLRRNLVEAGLHHVEVVEGRAEPFLEQTLADASLVAPDVVLVDPPRRGLAPGGAEALAALGAARVVYLSCDPATLARDLRVLCGGGYRLESLVGFDLFPQTPHVEALATLGRSAIQKK